MKSHLSYRGRFAPSPTGPLHFGSLVAALGSYLQARKAGGVWLLRMEDLDPPREKAGAADNILRTLEQFGLFWDGPVLYQSQRHDAYEAILEKLTADGRIYACQCTRKQIIRQARKTPAGYVYPGNCRSSGLPVGAVGLAIRLRTGEKQQCSFNDRTQGLIEQDVADQVGDFVLKRRDGLYAYQLAVVADDQHQQISEVVRGMDLLDNTPRQIYLQKCLGYATPDYLHLPLALNAAGDKLSKQTFADRLDSNQVLETLLSAWNFLGQKKPAVASTPQNLDDFYKFAIAHWQICRIPVTEAGYKIDPNLL